MPSYLDQLSAEQSIALRLYRRYNLNRQRAWKDELRHNWMTNSYDWPAKDQHCYLTQIRNRFGPSWLTNLTERVFPTASKGRYYIRPAAEDETFFSLFDRLTANESNGPSCLLAAARYVDCELLRDRLEEGLVEIPSTKKRFFLSQLAGWTKADSDASIAEGWCLSDTSDETNPLQLQRIDEPLDGDPVFEEDEHAWGFVWYKPLALHQKAIAILKEHNPREYLAIQAYIASVPEAPCDTADAEEEALASHAGYDALLGDS